MPNVRMCANTGELAALVDEGEWDARGNAEVPPAKFSTGRELFAFMRLGASGAEQGGSAMLEAAGL